MGEAPFFLFFSAGFFGGPAIGLELIQRFANVCSRPDWRIKATRLREGEIRPQRFWLIGY
jgi:hypothetical protein